jgi:predicted NBD/HSP70 family sugar kinase
MAEPAQKKARTEYSADCAPAVTDLLIVEPKVKAPLDPGFAPVVLAKKRYREAAKDCEDVLCWALPRVDGCARGELKAFKPDDKRYEATIILAGVMIQEGIWRCGAKELQLAGPADLCETIKKAFSKGGTYEFEASTMPKCNGEAEVEFKVTICGSAGDLPAVKDSPQECGKEANGSRLAFDLGKSDIKTVAIKDGKVLDSKETEWDVTNTDPEYHYKAIVDAMKGTIERAKKNGFGEIQAVGGSATGTVGADNSATWCDIFPNVPPDVYKEKVVDIFKRIAKDVAGDVPLKVINDGEVTALAAFQKIEKGNVMGISMGSSEGGGYANADGNLMGWINELCYIKLDMNPNAPTDPWTLGNHRGISHMYLGQRGATKNAWKITEVPENYKYPHPDMCTIKHETHAQCLKLIQKAMESNPDKAGDLYRTCGVYLGYGLAQYCESYSIEHVMILGRVSKGAGGDLMLKVAAEVLETEFPELPKITFHTADDHFKAVGQCIAAAALPKI